MKKLNTIKYFNFILLLFLLAKGTETFSQEDTSIQHEFVSFNSNNYQEKVFLHTDKTVYTAGEVLWFKAYVLNAQKNSSSLLSKICYVELINAENKPTLQAKIEIDSGRGSGSFLLPASIRTGNYLLRAYTNWMKNFDPQFYFEQSISIINPNKKPQITADSSASTVNIQFFPEGGNIVAGLNNTVAFKISNNYAQGLNATGYILNEQNDTITKFKTERFGTGTFSFTPEINNKYHALIIANDKKVEPDLPKIYNQGWVMHLAENNNELSIIVLSNIEKEKEVFLFIQCRDKIKYARNQSLADGKTEFIINKADMEEGISQLTIFNEEKQPVCERLYFKRPVNILKINSKIQDSVFEQRSKVNMDIITMDESDKTCHANISVSVYLVDSLQPELKRNIVNYAWLSSELKGTIESPDFYFENTNEATKAADNLMLTQGWRRFKWEDVLSNHKPTFNYLPEYEGFVISGKILPKKEGFPVNNISAYLSVVGKNFRFCNTTSQSAGEIIFNVQKFYGNRETVIQTNVADSNYRVVMNNPFSEKFNESHLLPIQLSLLLSSSIMQRSIGAQSINIYHPEAINNFNIMPSFDTTVFYGIPDRKYFLDDYTRFPTMEEVMREYVKEVHVRKREKNFYFKVLNEPYKTFFLNQPMVLIDGVPVWDINKIINIDPLKIQRIDVTTSAFFQGRKKFDGIVSYATYNGDLEGYQLDPNALAVEYEGLQLQREFFSPSYETVAEKDSRKPDFRNVLFWSPDVIVNNGKQNIAFFTSDIPGTYVVLIQGISANGEIGFTTTKFIVAN